MDNYNFLSFPSHKEFLEEIKGWQKRMGFSITPDRYADKPLVDKNVSVTVGSYYNGGSVVIVHAPLNEGFRHWAKDVGGRWKYPLQEESAWQFIVRNTANMEEFRAALDKALERFYPAREPSVIDLDRKSYTEQAPKDTVIESGEGKKISAAKIAEVVSRIVERNMEDKFDQFNDKIQQELDIQKSNVSARANAVESQIDAVNKRLDQVLRPIVIEIKQNDEVAQKDLGIQHYQFPKLLNLARALSASRRNIWISGPAGSGKTTAARELARALDLPFHFNGSIDTEYKLSGFIDAQGRVISTAFRKAWENGGVYLFDECDGSMPSALLAFNAALSNGHAAFPDGVGERHKNTVVLAAANTWGWGGTANYVGRAKLDAAFLDRFVKIPWEYDEAMERRIAGHDKWVDVVQNTRRLMKEKQASIVVSPRASINGAELLRAGLSNADVAEAIFSSERTHAAWSMVGKYVEEFAQEKKQDATKMGNHVILIARAQLKLVSYNQNEKLNVVKLIRETTGWGIAEAKYFVEGVLPQTFPLNGDYSVDSIIRRGRDIGAWIEVV